MRSRLPQIIDAIYERKAATDPRNAFRKHLGASLLGHTCLRFIWYGWRWCFKEELPGRMHRLFKRGDRAEQEIIEDLRLAGATVWQHDENGKQFRVELGGSAHLGGSVDGVGKGGIPEIDPLEPYLVEAKSHNDRSFTRLVDDGLLGAKFQHYVQTQCYMHGLELRKAVYGALNKNDETYEFYVLDYSAHDANRFIQRGLEVVDALIPPPRISKNPGWHECRYCPAKSICHKPAPPLKSCRTCTHASVSPTTPWQCGLGKKEIGDQTGCSSYRLLKTFYA